MRLARSHRKTKMCLCSSSCGEGAVSPAGLPIRREDEVLVQPKIPYQCLKISLPTLLIINLLYCNKLTLPDWWLRPTKLHVSQIWKTETYSRIKRVKRQVCRWREKTTTAASGSCTSYVQQVDAGRPLAWHILTAESLLAGRPLTECVSVATDQWSSHQESCTLYLVEWEILPRWKAVARGCCLRLVASSPCLSLCLIKQLNGDLCVSANHGCPQKDTMNDTNGTNLD